MPFSTGGKSAIIGEFINTLAGSPSQAASRPALPKGELLTKPQTLHLLPRPPTLGEVAVRQH